MNTLIAAILLSAPFDMPRWEPRMWTLSVYSTWFKDRTKANGKPYKHRAHTAATWAYDLGTRLEVEHLGRRVVVTVTDRIHRRFADTRIDLSGGAMKALQPEYDFTDMTAGLLRDARARVLP